MSQLEVLEILIDIGEDFAAQVFWTDEDGQAVPITTPARIDVRDTEATLILQFASENSGAVSTKAAITVTGSQGLLQLSCPKVVTRTLSPGRYAFDLWATGNAGVAPFATQLQKICSGWVVAVPRTTNTEAAAV